jgi:hypothetical protein
MFTWFVSLCLLPAILWALPNDHAAVDILRPRSISSDAFNRRVVAYWTPERLQNATNVDIIMPNATGRAASNPIDKADGPQSSVVGSLPSSNSTNGKALSTNGRHIYTTGRVFWSVGSYQYSCSASVVTSGSGSLIATAAHCVYDTNTRTWFNNNNWIFIPAYYQNTAPFGVWPARRMIVRNIWITSTDYNADVAFVALVTLRGRTIQSTVGSQGIAFNWPRLAFTYSLGYPINIYNGLLLQQCSGNAQASRWTQNSFIGQGLSCIMGGGSSGGPWLQNVVDATGIGYITSVNSFTVNYVPNVINGPYFEGNIASLYRDASNM